MRAFTERLIGFLVIAWRRPYPSSVRHPSRHIFEHDPEALKAWCAEHAMAAYRAEQILDWVYRKRVASPEAMSNLSKADRAALSRGMTFLSGTVVRHQVATDGTQKMLVEWGEGIEASRHQGIQQKDSMSLSVLDPGPGTQDSGLPQTECVMIPFEDRSTACISSQVGCPVGCRFCASGIGGLEGNLSAGRIVEQVWRLNQLVGVSASGAAPEAHDDSHGLPAGEEEEEGRDGSGRSSRGTRSGGVFKPLDFDALGAKPAAPEAPRITNVVFMGMGEPLANLPNVIRAVRTICAPWGMGISARKVTISTVGLPKAIERLADQLDLPVTLALSLHAPTDDLRRKLIPWAEFTTIKELLAACQKWFDKTGREITLEYTLLRGVNDRPEHAAELVRVAKSLRANVNLIRYNEVAGMEFKRPRQEDVLEFQRVLRARNVNTHIRRSRGRDIAAACGQLRHEHMSG